MTADARAAAAGASAGAENPTFAAVRASSYFV